LDPALIAYLLGVLALIAGAMAIVGEPLGRFTLAGMPLADAINRRLLRLIGVLVLSGGVALLCRSRWASPFFILSTLIETGYLLYASRVLPALEMDAADSRRRTIMAIYITAAVTAVVLWLEGRGVLT